MVWLKFHGPLIKLIHIQAAAVEKFHHTFLLQVIMCVAVCSSQLINVQQGKAAAV